MNLKNFKAAKEALETATKNKKSQQEIRELLNIADKAEANAKKANFNFLSQHKSGDIAKAQKELLKMTSDSKLAKFFSLKTATSFIGAAFLAEGVESYYTQMTGSSISPSGQLKEAAAIQNLPDSAALAAAGGAAANIADSTPTKGKSCIFGGHPSVWKDFGPGGIKCTRPEASHGCGEQEGDFLCNSYGIALHEGSIASELCLTSSPLDNLTVRCSEKLKAVLSQKKASGNTEKMAEFGKQLAEAAKRIEDLKGMTDIDGKQKSIAAYCAADAKGLDQKPECEAIREVLAVLKSTEMPKLLETRAVVAAAAPAPSANAPEAGKVETKQ